MNNQTIQGIKIPIENLIQAKNVLDAQYKTMQQFDKCDMKDCAIALSAQSYYNGMIKLAQTLGITFEVQAEHDSYVPLSFLCTEEDEETKKHEIGSEEKSLGDNIIGRNIRSRRLRAGLSDEELAKKVGVRAKTIVRYETEMPPSSEMIELLAAALGTTPSCLIGSDRSQSDRYGVWEK